MYSRFVAQSKLHFISICSIRIPSRNRDIIEKTVFLVNFNQPELQRPICRVLLMVPVYSLTSFLSLRFTQFSLYFDTLREWYEAYALYNFMALVLRFLLRNYDLRYVLEYKLGMDTFLNVCWTLFWSLQQFPSVFPPTDCQFWEKIREIRVIFNTFCV